jgi:hypothetical protein
MLVLCLLGIFDMLAFMKHSQDTVGEEYSNQNACPPRIRNPTYLNVVENLIPAN